MLVQSHEPVCDVILCHFNSHTHSLCGQLRTMERELLYHLNKLPYLEDKFQRSLSINISTIKRVLVSQTHIQFCNFKELHILKVGRSGACTRPFCKSGHMYRTCMMFNSALLMLYQFLTQAAVYLQDKGLTPLGHIQSGNIMMQSPTVCRLMIIAQCILYAIYYHGIRL